MLVIILAFFVCVSGLLRHRTTRTDLSIADIPYGHSKTAIECCYTDGCFMKCLVALTAFVVQMPGGMCKILGSNPEQLLCKFGESFKGGCRPLLRRSL